MHDPTDMTEAELGRRTSRRHQHSDSEDEQGSDVAQPIVEENQHVSQTYYDDDNSLCRTDTFDKIKDIGKIHDHEKSSETLNFEYDIAIRN